MEKPQVFMDLNHVPLSDLAGVVAVVVGAQVGAGFVGEESHGKGVISTSDPLIRLNHVPICPPVYFYSSLMRTNPPLVCSVTSLSSIHRFDFSAG